MQQRVAEVGVSSPAAPGTPPPPQSALRCPALRFQSASVPSSTPFSSHSPVGAAVWDPLTHTHTPLTHTHAGAADTHVSCWRALPALDLCPQRPLGSAAEVRGEDIIRLYFLLFLPPLLRRCYSCFSALLIFHLHSSSCCLYLPAPESDRSAAHRFQLHFALEVIRCWQGRHAHAFLSVSLSLSRSLSASELRLSIHSSFDQLRCLKVLDEQMSSSWSFGDADMQTCK